MRGAVEYGGRASAQPRRVRLQLKMLLICYACYLAANLLVATGSAHSAVPDPALRPVMSNSGALLPSSGKSGLPCRRGASL